MTFRIWSESKPNVAISLTCQEDLVRVSRILIVSNRPGQCSLSIFGGTY